MKRGLSTLASVALIVLVVAIVAVVLLMSSQRTGMYAGGGAKIYGGALKDDPTPYWTGRKEAGAYGTQPEAYPGIPARHDERATRQIPAGSRIQEPAYYEYQERRGVSIQ